MFEINRDVTCTVFQNYHFTVDEKIMAELNHYLDTEFGIAPITEEEAAAFMAMYHHYNEYNWSESELRNEEGEYICPVCEEAL